MAMKLSHRPTHLPGAPPDEDRTIVCDGVEIARAFRIECGQNEGRWQWAGQWWPAEFFIVDTLEEALAAIKAAVIANKL